jgi:hypothetical protein
MKKLLSALVAGVMTISCTLFPCYAVTDGVSTDRGSENRKIVYEDDGSYEVTELISSTPSNASFEGISTFSAISTVTKSKRITKYDASGDQSYSFTLTATFSYSGSTASATSASYRYAIYDNAWSFRSGSTRLSRNTAYGTGTFSYMGLKRTVDLKMSCSAKGVVV